MAFVYTLSGFLDYKYIASWREIKIPAPLFSEKLLYILNHIHIAGLCSGLLVGITYADADQRLYALAKT